jgi:AraC-binding-like domain
VVNSSKPLANFPFFRSRSIEDVSAAMTRIYAKPVLVPMRGADGFDTVLNNCRLRHIDLAYAAFGAAMGFDFPETDIFSLLLPIRGSGEIISGRTSVALTVGTCGVTSAGTSHFTNCSADYEHLVLRVHSRVLTEKLSAMTGASISEPLRISEQPNWRHPAAQMLQQYVPLLVNTLSDARPPFPNWWVEQTEQLLMTLFLCGHRHNYSHLLDEDVPDAALRQVRQAEEYIEANAQRVVTLEELAELTGVSVFSLFSAFKKYRGYSPLTFLSQARSKRGGTPG